jgi:membrane-associated protease RseP (regulator of RpoE activity)
MSESPIPQEGPVETSDALSLDQIESKVVAQFEVEEAMIEYGVPTFFVKLGANSKQKFIKLLNDLDPMGLSPLLRHRKGRNVLKVVPKPKTKPSRPIINVILLLATIGTVLITGYVLSLSLVDEGLNPFLGAGSFALALLGILGAHEMGHKFAANHHGMEATMPYFIPGPPAIPGFFLGGIGTFGAVIVQKENAPNRDALFDIGASGPIAGFVLTVVVTAVGLMLSPIRASPTPLEGGLPISYLFMILGDIFVNFQPAPDIYYYILLHPIAFAGWIGMFVTVLNLLPTGMLDGGHTLRSLIDNDMARTVFNIVSVLVLLLTQQYIMLAFVLFLSMYRHPGPLDDVSKLSLSRKFIAVLLLIIFGLCLFIF